MGVPKFFRFISERYPMISQLVEENSIPEFDNLYLDMNGIIHQCTHPSEENPHFRLTPEQMYTGIFNYIEILFSKIKPKKLFFMAMDGVAPRAKMNQQRSRRFKTAREADIARQKAVVRGEELPPEPPFDSNAITPGTEFMAILSEQIKYFVKKKVNEDADWRDIKVIFSGHEVPGEGEHKVMEFIRYSKAQPDRDPNTRHCLYGLDADLIMLALLSHDPHFCLLREEVNFGPKAKKSKSVETTNFFLLHIALLREYLDLEFQDMHQDPRYDFERVIDDVILLFMLVGNDFLPHLPKLHINGGGIGLLFNIYKKILPEKGGYLNEHGKLNLPKLQRVFDHLGEFEKEVFVNEESDAEYIKGKQNEVPNIEKLSISSTPQEDKDEDTLVLSPQQRELFNTVKSFVKTQLRNGIDPSSTLALPATYPAKDRKFLSDLTEELGLEIYFDEFDQDDNPLIAIRFEEDLASISSQTIGGNSGTSTPRNNSSSKNGFSELENDEGPVSHEAFLQEIQDVINLYDNAATSKAFDKAELEEKQKNQFEQDFTNWKSTYYHGKFEWKYGPEMEQNVKQLSFKYIEGLQWILHYYYDGIVSWGWFFPYHYAPKISDIKDVNNYQFDFKLGAPFTPFQQLMGVLPVLSSTLIPEAFRELMSNPESPIIKFYPCDFESDLNEKKQEWEAVVKIPFIEEDLLLNTMAPRYKKLASQEAKRDQFGPAWEFFYDGSPDNVHLYPSSLPNVFPDITNCYTKMVPFYTPKVASHQLVKGLSEGALTGKDALAGFPSISTLSHSAKLLHHPVRVFQQDSRGETMVITVDNEFKDDDTESLAHTLIGNRLFVNWPFLREAMVVKVSDHDFTYERELDSNGTTSSITKKEHKTPQQQNWIRSSNKLEKDFSRRYGVKSGSVNIIVHVNLLKGLKPMEDGALVKEYDDILVDHAVQVTVKNVSSEDPRYLERAAIPVEEDYPANSKVFLLSHHVYGTPAVVIGHEQGTLALQTFPNVSDHQVIRKFSRIVHDFPSAQYVPSPFLSRTLKMTPLTLSKITSSALVSFGESRLNIGLNLKFDSKGLKVLGYTRKSQTGWEFSSKAIELIKEYKTKFPEVFKAFDANRGSDITQGSQIFAEANLETRMQALKSWLDEIGSRDFEKVPLYSEKLDPDAIEAIEKEADKLANKPPGKSGILRKVPRRCVLKSEQASMRLSDQEFSIGDRVVNVVEYGTTNIGAHGTVVAISQNGVDVVYDETFMGGNTLGGRCSQYRGQTLSKHAVLNLTNPQIVIFSKPPRSDKRQQGENKPWLFGGPAQPQSNKRRGEGPSSRGGHAQASNGHSAGLASTPRILQRGRGGANHHVASHPHAHSNVQPGQQQPALSTESIPVGPRSDTQQPQQPQQSPPQQQQHQQHRGGYRGRPRGHHSGYRNVTPHSDHQQHHEQQQHHHHHHHHHPNNHHSHHHNHHNETAGRGRGGRGRGRGRGHFSGGPHPNGPRGGRGGQPTI